jgi:hypothetical protein
MISFTIESARFPDGTVREQRVSGHVLPRIGEFVDCKEFCGYVKNVLHDYTQSKAGATIVTILVRLV